MPIKKQDGWFHAGHASNLERPPGSGVSDNRRTGQRPRLMNPPDANPKVQKILVIDDNPIIQRALYFTLRDRGYHVLLCGDVDESLTVVRRERPDLILLDINFPLMVVGDKRDGFWALGWLRHMEEARNTPVIVISTNPPEQSEGEALAAGAAAYFHKPIDKHELAAVGDHLLDKPVAQARV